MFPETGGELPEDEDEEEDDEEEEEEQGKRKEEDKRAVGVKEKNGRRISISRRSLREENKETVEATKPGWVNLYILIWDVFIV